jgi:hypothetical protein
MTKFEKVKAILEHPNYGGEFASLQAAAGDPSASDVIAVATRSHEHLTALMWIATTVIAAGGPESLAKFLASVHMLVQVLPSDEALGIKEVA